MTLLHVSRLFILLTMLSFCLPFSSINAEEAESCLLDRAEDKANSATNSYQLAKDHTTEALLTAYEKLKSKIANLVLISRADILATNQDYKEIFLKEEDKDQDLRKIYEERYRLACKKVDAITISTDNNLRKYNKIKEQADKVRRELEDLEQAQMSIQMQLRNQLNEISSVYAIELEQARKTTEFIRRKAAASHQSVKKIVEEEIRVLRKGVGP